MIKKIVLTVGLIAILLAFFYFSQQEQNPTSGHFRTIGVLQTASFPPLDATRDAFLNEMQALYGDRIRIEMQNAQGSIAQAQAIAVSFKANKNMVAYFAIATPAAQTLKAQIKDKPIVFADVTDPHGLGLLSPQGNIAGTSDMADIPRQIQLIRALMPHLKKVSILYTPGEPNSVVLVKQMQEELDRAAIEVRLVGVNSQADVAASTQAAVSDAELLLIPTDNNITAAFSVVRQVATQANVPVVVTWTGETEGVLMQFGVDYSQAGVQAAKIMEQVLAGVAPGSIPLGKPDSEIILSREEIQKYKIVVPDELHAVASYL
jgi:putative ABC transport system substrate-binding protein